MTREKLFLFDTTLRDGAQTNGIDFSLEDKITISNMLDQLGLDYIEGGYPGANLTDTEFFAQKRLKQATFTAFGMTKRPGISVSNDPGLAALLSTEADAICYVGKSWDYHVETALKCTLEENLQSIEHSIRAAIDSGHEAMLDCEHFFDGYKANPDYARACAKAAFDTGARWIVLCDTNGGTLPHEVSRIVSEIAETIPGKQLGIHAHNDTENAVANSLAAIDAGVRQIQGTLNGIGERCGNANMVSLIPTLLLKPDYHERFETGIADNALARMTKLSRAFDELLNRFPNAHAPYVGRSAFATKAGIHASAILKDPKTYEHVAPESVGNSRRLLVSDQAGKSNLISALDRMGLSVRKDDPRLDGLLQIVKEREAAGYAFEAADASLELLARRHLYGHFDYYKVLSFRVAVERRFNALGEMVTVSDAVVKVEVDGEVFMSVAEGNGPVNALDIALRKDLGKYQAAISDMDLVDYKVRILNGGSEAVTRVLIESRDSRDGSRWTTVGVSENIVDASFQALTDSIIFTLVKSEAHARNG